MFASQTSIVCSCPFSQQGQVLFGNPNRRSLAKAFRSALERGRCCLSRNDFFARVRLFVFIELDKKPKCRILRKRLGRMCKQKRRKKSWPCKVIVLCAVPNPSPTLTGFSQTSNTCDFPGGMWCVHRRSCPCCRASSPPHRWCNE